MSASSQPTQPAKGGGRGGSGGSGRGGNSGRGRGGSKTTPTKSIKSQQPQQQPQQQQQQQPQSASTSSATTTKQQQQQQQKNQSKKQQQQQQQQRQSQSVKQQVLLQLQQQEQRELELKRQKQAEEDAALALKAQQKADARAQRLLQMRQRKAEAHARELDLRRSLAEATRNARRELRLLNQRASSGVKGARPDRDFFKALDSTLKKNTAFVRKVRLLAPDNAEATLLEASKLNLSRFLQELTPAVVEARLKRADILPTVQLCSLLHQRHAEFMTELMPMIFAAFAAVKGERAEQFVRQRAYLMLLSECYVAHCVPDTESAGTVGALYGRPLVKLIDELIASDEQTVVDRADSIVVNAPQPFVLGLVVTFAQRGDEAFLGVMKRLDRALPPLAIDDAADDNNDADADVDATTAESAGGDAPDTNDAAESGEYAPADAADIVFGEAARAALRTRLLTYFERVSKHAATMFTRASKQAFLDEQALNLKGELSDERKSSSAMLRTYVDRLVADATALAAVLGVSMPELVAYKEEIVVAPQFEIDDLVRGDSYDVLWGDVDTRRFYENLPPLREMLPTALVGEGSGFIGNTDDTAGGDGLDVADPVFADSNGDDNDDDNVDGDGAVAANNADDAVVVRPVDGSVHNDQLLQVFDKLMAVGNRQQLDDAVLEFAYLHTKRARERLVDFLYGVPWNRPELVPYFARAAATLAQIMHDVAPPLAVLVEKQFYGQLLNKHSVKLESKLRTGKMLAEMCKFRIVAPIVVFRVLHRCLQDWSPHFVQVMCAMLESCGRFLFLMPHTHRRTAELLTVLLRKMQSRPLDGHLTAAIENAMYACKPPPDFKAGRVRVRPPPEEAYIADLLYRRLSADTVRHVLRVLRSLPLADPTWRARTLRLMLAVHRMRYSTLEVFASTVAGLSRDWPGFVTTYVDALVERIRTGLLQRDQRRHLRQTVEVRLFAELYNYEQFQSDAVFNVLYYIILLGHSADPREINRLDPPSDWFRVRLVCATLDTCGLYFNRGPAAARLDRFLVFFQRYLFIKVSLPIEIQFVVDELFNDLRPEMKRFESYEEAHAAVLAIEQNEALATAVDNAAAAAAAVSEESSRLHASYDEGGSSAALDASREIAVTSHDGGTPDVHSDDELAATTVADDDAAAVDDVPRVDDDLIDALGDQSDDSDVDEVAPDEDTFERDYASMINEGGSKRRAHVNMSGMAIPMGLGHSSDGKSSGDTRQLRFLQKKQGHQAVKSNLVSRTIVVPEDTSIARAAVANRAEELATKLAIRDFVLARVAAGFDD